MLQFNSRGCLIPGTILKSTIQELEHEFVKNIPSASRKRIFEKYQFYSDRLKIICENKPIKQWINGSFTTKKTEPGDIDIVSFIDYSILNNPEKSLHEFAYPFSEQIYEVDAYIVPFYPEEHRLHFLFTSDRLDWLDRFNKTWLNRIGKRYPKGFLEINY